MLDEPREDNQPERDRGDENGGEARRQRRFRERHAAVAREEQQDADDSSGEPGLGTGLRRARARSAAPGRDPPRDRVEQRSGYDKPDTGEEQRRQMSDPDADRQVGASPHTGQDTQRYPAQHGAAGFSRRGGLQL